LALPLHVPELLIMTMFTFGVTTVQGEFVCLPCS
jgi:hypothetical protein